VRFLLADFFARISYSCRSEKNAQLYIAAADMEGFKTGFSPVSIRGLENVGARP
jgi:hypothetical protein